jgi:rhamnosyltransferase
MISVVVVAKNEASRIGATLERVFAQRGARADEVLVVDAGSRDSTVAVARGFPVRIETVPAAAFSHGGTRQWAAGRVQGEHIVFLNADALPADDQWLATLMRVFDKDPAVAGVYSRIVPPAGLNPLDARDIFEDDYLNGPAIKRLTADETLFALAPEERRRRAAFHTISCAINRSLLLHHPFAALAFGEDIEWAARMLTHRRALGYARDSMVVHGHEYHRSLVRTVQKYYDDSCCSRNVIKRFGVRGFLRLHGVWIYKTAQDWRFLATSRPPYGRSWYVRAPFARAAEWVGSMLAFVPLPGFVRRRLSLVARIKAE